MNRTLLGLIAMLAAVGAGASAHHRDADVYVEGRELTVEGHVSQLILRNPHSFLIITTQAGPRPPERWVIELSGASRLQREGIAADTFRVGQRVIARGAPGRIPADRRLRLHAIVRPSDGWRWSAASF